MGKITAVSTGGGLSDDSLSLNTPQPSPHGSPLRVDLRLMVRRCHLGPRRGSPAHLSRKWDEGAHPDSLARRTKRMRAAGVVPNAHWIKFLSSFDHAQALAHRCSLCARRCGQDHCCSRGVVLLELRGVCANVRVPFASVAGPERLAARRVRYWSTRAHSWQPWRADSYVLVAP